ncbi:MAG TPA: PLP-dependent aminotransferase family protein [Burkholderiales bacterium]|nr:PLP-dependent aminotransferase family protein [Burkholderiales bacterium]
MIRTNSLLPVHLALDRRRRSPLHRQIYQRYRHAIEQGLLAPGERVASARALASELGVARGTVEAAYAQLSGEGYLQTRGQAGTVVAPHLPAPTRARPAPKAAPALPARAAAPAPFQLGIPALDAFPRKLWSRLGARCIRATTPADLNYADPAGHAPLRQALATYLLVSRGVACAAHQVFITGGHRASLALATRLLLKPGERAWVEDPGYPPAREVLQSCGARLVFGPVDAEGLVIENEISKGKRSARVINHKARLAIVTPSHQAPLGVSLSLPRRLQLLQWAESNSAWVIEDDYDGEYRYTGPPLPALKSLDTADRVIYAGSFSKVLFPGLALSYLVVPETLAARFDAACRAAGNGPPQLTQAIVAAFISEGHFARHLKKMRLLYARRRALLTDALRAAFGDSITIALTSGGMHLILRFKRRRNDQALARRAQQMSLMCMPLSERAVEHDCGEGLLMGFTNVDSAATAQKLARALHAAIG